MPKTTSTEEAQSKSKFSTQTAIIIAGIMIAGAILLTGYLGNNPPTGPTDILANVRKVTDKDHIRGSLGAPVTIIEYSDLECPFCKLFHETMNRLMAVYNQGEISWVYRHFPLDVLHQKARPEAEAAECVAILSGNTVFWNYIDKIFEVTPSNDGLDLALLDQLAADLGVDPADFADCRQSKKTKQIVQADVDNAIHSGGQGTPFVILITPDGRRFDLGGAVPFELLKQTIDQILSEDGIIKSKTKIWR